MWSKWSYHHHRINQSHVYVKAITYSTYSGALRSSPSVVKSVPSANMLRSGSVIRITPNNPNKPYGPLPLSLPLLVFASLPLLLLLLLVVVLALASKDLAAADGDALVDEEDDSADGGAAGGGGVGATIDDPIMFFFDTGASGGA